MRGRNRKIRILWSGKTNLQLTNNQPPVDRTTQEARRLVRRVLAGNNLCQEAQKNHERQPRMHVMVCGVGIGGYVQKTPSGPVGATFECPHGAINSWELVDFQ